MEKYQIRIDDINRILFGNAPEVFILETIIRTVIIYTALLVTLRLMGKRMAGQLSIAEMAVMLALGSIASSAMQEPTTGILFGIFILLCMLFFQRGLNFLEFQFPRLHTFNHGKSTLLIKDGVLLLHMIDDTGLSRQQVFGVLRGKGIYNLARVDRMYLETSGIFSIYINNKAQAGFSIIPAESQSSMDMDTDHLLQICQSCGYTKNMDKGSSICPNCQSTDWGNATTY